MPEEELAPQEVLDLHEGEGEKDDHEVPKDLLQLHVALEAKEAGLL